MERASGGVPTSQVASFMRRHVLVLSNLMIQRILRVPTSLGSPSSATARTLMERMNCREHLFAPCRLTILVSKPMQTSRNQHSEAKRVFGKLRFGQSISPQQE